MNKAIKHIGLVMLLGAGLFVSNINSQSITCPVKLRVFSFIGSTTHTNPIEGASVTVTDVKSKKSFNVKSANGEALIDGVSQKTYSVSVTKDGFITSKDMIAVECSTTFVPPQASPDARPTFNHSIVMWEGDPSQTITYLSGQALLSTKTSGPLKADKNTSYKIGTAAPATTGKIPDNGDRGEAVARSSGAFKIGAADSSGPAYSGPATITTSGPIAPGAVSKGVMNGSAVVLAKPTYPPTAKAVGASGAVNVQVTIDENGYVVSSHAVSGHPLLRAVSAFAARASRFKPTTLAGQPVKVSGIIVYNFQ